MMEETAAAAKATELNGPIVSLTEDPSYIYSSLIELLTSC
jgi:hypothetical protein